MRYNDVPHDNDAPQTFPQAPDAAEMPRTDGQVIDIRLPALAPDRPHTLLTAAALLRTRPRLAGTLRAYYAVQFAPTWEELPDAIAQMPPDLVLLDMDRLVTFVDGDGGSEQPCAISGRRLVKLLAHQLDAQRAHPAALIVLTALDYAELEDLAPDISALLTPDTAPREVIASMDAVLARRVRRHVTADATTHAPTRLH